MRFLVDTQLPSSLAALLRRSGHEAEHVLDLHMGQSSDRDIWKYACAHQAIVVTKDEDFAQWAIQIPQGAGVLWIRLGNSSNSFLLAAVLSVLPSIIARFAEGETLVELR